MIPKIIHYCWFGGNPLPELAHTCIDSWKRVCPDYEIREWNESNFNLRCCEYVEEAYQAKKWAFVSDFVRFWILYNEGGVYFDTDVELIRPIDDIIEKGAFFGLERRDENGRNSKVMVAPGLGMAAESHNPVYKEILELYNQLHFVNEDGTYNKTTVVNYVTEVMKKHNLPEELDSDNEIIKVHDICIYPWDYFCPMSYVTGDVRITKNTYSIHHYTASWKTDEEMQMKKIEQKTRRIFNAKIGNIIAKVLVMPLRLKMKLKQYGLKKTIQLVIIKRKK